MTDPQPPAREPTWSADPEIPDIPVQDGSAARDQPGPFAPSAAPAGYAPPPGYGPPSAYPPPAGYGPVTSYGQPAGGYGTPPLYGSRTNTKAVVALCLAIGSFVVLPLIPAIVALVLAPSARREIARSQGNESGLGLVTAATIVAWINVGVFTLLIVGALLLIGVPT